MVYSRKIMFPPPGGTHHGPGMAKGYAIGKRLKTPALHDGWTSVCLKSSSWIDVSFFFEIERCSVIDYSSRIWWCLDIWERKVWKMLFVVNSLIWLFRSNCLGIHDLHWYYACFWWERCYISFGMKSCQVMLFFFFYCRYVAHDVVNAFSSDVDIVV